MVELRYLLSDETKETRGDDNEFVDKIITNRAYTHCVALYAISCIRMMTVIM